jgi:hypothetical protein
MTIGKEGPCCMQRSRNICISPFDDQIAENMANQKEKIVYQLVYPFQT